MSETARDLAKKYGMKGHGGKPCIHHQSYGIAANQIADLEQQLAEAQARIKEMSKTHLTAFDTVQDAEDYIDQLEHETDEMRIKLAEAQARIKELEEDKDRLDWLDVYADNCENLRQGWWITASGEHEGKTLRQAIDTAMQAEQEAK